MKRRVTTEPGTQAVQRSLEILNCFHPEQTRWRLKDLSLHLGIARSTLHRLLSVLTIHGFIEKDIDTKEYRLGLKIYELQDAVEVRQLISKLSHPFLQELSNDTGEICHLAIRVDNEMMYVDKVEGIYRFTLRTHMGMRLPLNIGGLGKVLLAYADPMDVKYILKNITFVRYTKNTIMNREKLKEILLTIRTEGFAIDNEEFEEGLTCVGVPVFDSNAKLLAALSISGPISRLNKNEMPNYIKKTMDSGEKISRAFGYKGNYPTQRISN